MSRTSKVFFAFSMLVATASIGGVHLLQIQEREVRPPEPRSLHSSADRCAPPAQTMFQGVIKDEARMAAKKQQKLRELEFEEQTRLRAYLENKQGVSNPVVPPPDVRGEVPTTGEGLDFGCKTGMCERP